MKCWALCLGLGHFFRAVAFSLEGSDPFLVESWGEISNESVICIHIWRTSPPWYVFFQNQVCFLSNLIICKSHLSMEPRVVFIPWQKSIQMNKVPSYSLSFVSLWPPYHLFFILASWGDRKAKWAESLAVSFLFLFLLHDSELLQCVLCVEAIEAAALF